MPQFQVRSKWYIMEGERIHLTQLTYSTSFIRSSSFFLFLAALAVVYIYNGHYADNISRDITRTDKEVKELQYEYKTLKSEVMFRSKQSELARAVAPFGLKELTRPPYILADSTQ